MPTPQPIKQEPAQAALGLETSGGHAATKGKGDDATGPPAGDRPDPGQLLAKPVGGCSSDEEDRTPRNAMVQDRMGKVPPRDTTNDARGAATMLPSDDTPQDWLCLSCNHRNLARFWFREACYFCGAVTAPQDREPYKRLPGSRRGRRTRGPAKGPPPRVTTLPRSTSDRRSVPGTRAGGTGMGGLTRAAPPIKHKAELAARGRVAAQGQSTPTKLGRVDGKANRIVRMVPKKSPRDHDPAAPGPPPEVPERGAPHPVYNPLAAGHLPRQP